MLRARYRSTCPLSWQWMYTTTTDLSLATQAILNSHETDAAVSAVQPPSNNFKGLVVHLRNREWRRQQTEPTANLCYSSGAVQARFHSRSAANGTSKSCTAVHARSATGWNRGKLIPRWLHGYHCQEDDEEHQHEGEAHELEDDIAELDDDDLDESASEGEEDAPVDEEVAEDETDDEDDDDEDETTSDSETESDSSEDDEESDDDILSEAMQRLMDEVNSLQYQGKLNEAEYLLTEGIKTAENALGEDNVQLAPLLDNLSLLRFMLGRQEAAAESARKALHIAQQYYGEEDAAQAVCQTRLGCILTVMSSSGSHEMEEAQQLLSSSYIVLQQTFGDDHESVGENLYYQGLGMVKAAGTVEEVESAGEQLSQGLDIMCRCLEASDPAIYLALLHHNKVISETPLGQDTQPLLLSLMQQEVQLHKKINPWARHVALMYSQIGTLHYASGATELAVEGYEQAMEVAEHNIHEGTSSGDESSSSPGSSAEDTHMKMEAQQRLGMIAALEGRQEDAEQLLQAPREHFSTLMGEDNPMAIEYEYAMHRGQFAAATADEGDDAAGEALMMLREDIELLKSKVGEEHLLVKALERDYSELMG